MKLTDDFQPLPGIYIIRNITNGKYYIGETMNIKLRMISHRTRAKRVKEQVVHKAINKYGLNNFEIEIYYLPNFSKNDLLDLEEQLIIKFNSLTPNGYNICSRGQNGIGRIFSKEARGRMSVAQTGRKHSPETIEKMKKSNKRINLGKSASCETKKKMSDRRKGSGNSMYGRVHSEETKRKIAEKAKSRKLSPETKKKISESGKLRHALRKEELLKLKPSSRE